MSWLPTPSPRSRYIPSDDRNLLPEDQAAEDAVVRLYTRMELLGQALTATALHGRTHALAAALAIPAANQRALTQFAMDWLVYLASHDPTTGDAEAIRSATSFIADTSCLAPPCSPTRAD